MAKSLILSNINSKVLLLSTIIIVSSCAENDPDYTLSAIDYQNKENSIGSLIKLRIQPGDEPEVWMNKVRVTDDDHIQFDVTINSNNDFAYAQLKNSNANSEVILNRQVIDDDAFNYLTTLSNSALYWFKSKVLSDQFYICQFLLENANKVCRQLPFFPHRYAVTSDSVLITGFDVSTDNFVFLILDPELNEVLLNKEYSNSIYLTENENGLYLREVSGDEALVSAFHAYTYYYNEFYNNPFSVGNDFLGRISWHVSYRLLGMQELFLKTKDPDIKKKIVVTIRNLLETQGEKTLFRSKKYSIDQETGLELAVDNAAIYRSMLSGWAHLPGSLQLKLKLKAIEVYDLYEKDWYGHYRFQSCINFWADGIPMPFNQQNMMGLLAIKLYEITGDIKYKTRVAELYENFLNELYTLNNVIVWNYWPETYYQGWASWEYSSCQLPSQDAAPPLFAEDNSHAIINFDFIVKASELLEVRPVADIEAIIAGTHLGGNQFSFSIDGYRGSRRAPTYSYLPQWGNSSLLRRYFSRLIVFPQAAFDSQRLFRAHAQSIPETIPVNTQIQIKLHEIADSNVQESAETRIQQLENNCEVTHFQQGKVKHIDRNETSCFKEISEYVNFYGYAM